MKSFLKYAAGFLLGAILFAGDGALAAFNPQFPAIPLAVQTYRAGVTLAAAPLLGYVSVDWYGADPTGTNDSTAAIQVPLTALGTTSPVKIVFSAQGTYKIQTNYLTIPAGSTNWEIDCQGADIQQTTTNVPIFVLKGTTRTIDGEIHHCNFGYVSAQNASDTDSIAIDFGSPSGEGGQWSDIYIHDINTGAGYGNDVYQVVAKDPNTGNVLSTIDRSQFYRFYSSAIGGWVGFDDGQSGQGGVSGDLFSDFYGFSTSITAAPGIRTFGCNECNYTRIDRTGFNNTACVTQPLIYVKSGANNMMENDKTENEKYCGTGMALFESDFSFNTTIINPQMVSDIINLTGGDNFCLEGDVNTTSGIQVSISGVEITNGTYTSGNAYITCPASITTLTQPNVVDGSVATVLPAGAANLQNGITGPSGTWTPSDGSADGLTYASISHNNYQVAGRQVTACATFVIPTNAGTHNITVAGLPFTPTGDSFSGWATNVSSGSSTLLWVGATNGSSSLSVFNDAGTQLINSNQSNAAINFCITYLH